MSSMNNALSYGVQKLFLVANDRVAFIRNPASTYVGTSYAYPAGGGGHNLDEMVVLTDALEKMVYDNGYGAVDPNYSLRQEARVWLNQIIRFTSHRFLPNTNTFTGFTLGGVPNNNQQYKATIITSGNHHNFDHRDHRNADHSYVKTGTGWNVQQMTAYLLYGWLVNPIDKSYPKPLSNYVEVIGVPTWATLNGAINVYKANPTTATYTALEIAWANAKTAFFNSPLWTGFVANPTLLNAQNLGSVFQTIAIRSIYPDVVTIGFSDYFDNISNTLTVTQHLPLVPVSATNGLKGSYGAGTFDIGQKHCQGTHNFYPFVEAVPYCKVRQGNEYAELFFQYNAREKTPAIHAENSQMMTLMMFVKMNGTGTQYHIDNGSGSVATGTINSPASLDTFRNSLVGAFPELIN